MSFLDLLVIFCVFSLGDYFVIKWEIKHNIELFYDLHRKEVDSALYSHKKDDQE